MPDHAIGVRLPHPKWLWPCGGAGAKLFEKFCPEFSKIPGLLADYSPRFGSQSAIWGKMINSTTSRIAQPM